MGVDLKDLQQWIGRTDSRHDKVTPVPIMALSATLDREIQEPRIGDPLPPLWHWLYFLPMDRTSDLSADGHAQRGGFLPPVPLPRRMWAGSRFQFQRELRVGDNISRSSAISDVTYKEGRTGPLVFVKLRHEISNDAGGAISEEQDLVYRENPKSGDPPRASKTAPAKFDWQRRICPDPVLLFRYSALTFNGHRIHYDRRHATEVEGYPGLVVHGPLIATLLLDLLRRNLPQAVVKEFVFRAERPLFDTAECSVCGRMGENKVVELWAQNAEGQLAAEGSAIVA